MDSNSAWEHKVFQSSNIHSGSYHPHSQTLLLRYGKSQTEYEYAVPPALWERLKNAQSPGGFTRQHITPYFIGSKAK